MQEVFNFLVDHWEALSSVFLLILSVVFFILKKKPLGNVYTLIFRYCLAAVVMAEEHPVKGDAKKSLAIEAVHQLLLDEYPTLDVSKYDTLISNCIETILSTPQKKGEK